MVNDKHGFILFITTVIIFQMFKRFLCGWKKTMRSKLSIIVKERICYVCFGIVHRNGVWTESTSASTVDISESAAKRNRGGSCPLHQSLAKQFFYCTFPRLLLLYDLNDGDTASTGHLFSHQNLDHCKFPDRKKKKNNKTY